MTYPTNCTHNPNFPKHTIVIQCAVLLNTNYTSFLKTAYYIYSPAISFVPSILWPRRKMKQNIHFSSKIICNSFKFLFIVMPLKMAALCLNASLETLRQLCYHGTHCLQGDLCRCFHEGSLQTVQVVVTLWASHVLQNSPQFIVPGVEVWTPQGPKFGADKGQNIPLQPLLSRLGFWAGNESCWRTHSWPLKRVTLSCFTTPCGSSSWYTWTPVSPLSCKNKDVSPPNRTPPTKPWRRKGDGIPAPSECTSRDISA